MNREVLSEQIAFYRARAPEYDQSWVTRHELEAVTQSLRTMGPFGEALELAPGRGLWTQELVHICRSITAIDASPEMIALNRQSVGSDRVTYQEHDLFRWEPDRQYDLVFAGFWLSHVPPDAMDHFLARVCRALGPGGTVMFVDQCNDIRDEAQGETEGILQRRRVADGRTFVIVKVYYHPGLLGGKFREMGFDVAVRRIGESFFSIVGRKR
ncbi:MAG TPA: class I SAM-dependent methyltransferase [bacterium]|nr:class I SAM-dependent methyltransferase [bacterium]